MTWTAIQAAVTGFVSGILSGMFGIGGGIITTPALKLWLETPALVAVATPLVAIIPGALTGAVAYTRARVADVRAGLIVGVAGVPAAVLGALLTRRVGGDAVLVVTALLVVWMAGDMLLQAARRPAPHLEGVGSQEADPGLAGSASGSDAAEPARPRTWLYVFVGVLAGFYSGFLGLGGGFVIVPLLTRFGRFAMRQAVGTSLVAITVLAVPGTITHALLGNIDWTIGVALIAGIIPGALLGARISLGSSERFLRIGFALLLIVAGLALGADSLGWMS